MYAIIETGGKQVRVEVGQKIFVEKLDVKENDQVTLTKVLLVQDKTLKVGKPFVDGASVTAKVVKNGKGKKLHIYKYKAKHNSARRSIGHRQPYTCLVIEAINA